MYITATDIEDDTNSLFPPLLSRVYKIGKIYFETGHPYEFGKLDTDVFFTRNSDYKKIGLFFPSRELPSTIDINRMNNNSWEIFIADTDTSFERIQTGIYK